MAAPRLEAKVQFPGLGKEDTPEPLVIPGGGLARRLLAACQNRGMQVWIGTDTIIGLADRIRLAL